MERFKVNGKAFVQNVDIVNDVLIYDLVFESFMIHQQVLNFTIDDYIRIKNCEDEQVDVNIDLLILDCF